MKGLAFALALIAASPAMAQSVTVDGLDRHVRTFSAQQLAAFPRDRVSLKSHDGKTTTYEGALLSALLRAVDAPTGAAMRGADMTDIVLVTASDGYRVAFTLAEIDPSIRGEKIILADRADGRPLAATEGPLRLVVDGDLRPARAARMVTRVRLLRFVTGRRKP